MDKIYKKQLLCGTLFLLLSFGASAQELKKHFSVSWTSKDTTYIIKLINEGHTLIFNNPDSALHFFRKAVNISLSKGFEDGAGYALGYIGFVQASKGNIQNAYATYTEALRYCVRAKYLARALPSLYINMAATYRSIGLYEPAIQYYYKALAYLQQNLPNDPNILIIYSNLAGVHAGLNQFSRAMMYARQAEALSLKWNNKNTLVSSQANIGALFTQMKMPDSAVVYLQKALKIAREMGHTDKEQFVLVAMGDLYKEMGEPTVAIEYYEEAIHLSRHTNLLYSSILPSYALGEALMQTRQYEKAERILLNALEVSERTGIITSRQKAYKTLSAVYEATGDYEKSLAYYQKYERLNDSLASIAKAAAISEAETRYQVEQKDKLIAENNFKIMRQEKELAQNRMRTLVLVISGVLLAVVVIVIFYYRNKIEKRNRHMMYLKAVMDGEEKERDRMARELHDGIGGMLTAMQMNIGALMEHKDIRPTELSGLAFLATHIGEEVHKTARNLTPQILQNHNLYQALIHYCEQFEKNSPLRIHLQFMGETEQLDKSLELILYRIIQELIQNIYKHAGATQAIVQLRMAGQMLYLSAEDDGAGFNAAEVQEGLGLQHIRNRIASLNGFCSIESAPGKGTSVYIEINQNSIPV